MGTARGRVLQVLDRFHHCCHAFRDELTHNKIGWLTSLVVHSAALVLAAFLVVAVSEVRHRPPVVFSSPLETLRDFDDELPFELPSPEESSDYRYEELSLAEMTDARDKLAGPLAEDIGADWIGVGNPLDGTEGGGEDPLGGPDIPPELTLTIEQGGRHGLDLVFVFDATGSMGPVSYTHLTLPTN